MATAQTTLLNADKISISRGVMPVLTQLDIALPAGVAMVITGANGSGKTTLLRALAGLLPIDQGRISINNIGIDDDRLNLLENIIYIGHKDGLSGALTVAENIRIWSKAHGMDFDDQILEQAFDDLGMAGFMDAEARRLSEGQRRRSGLVRLALSHRALKNSSGQMKKLWLLDEPLTAIDAQAAVKLCRLIDQHTEAGGSAMISTHSQIDLARKIALDLTPYSLTSDPVGAE